MEYCSSQTCLTATGTHVPYGITPRNLPLGRGDISPLPWPIKAGTQFSDSGGCEAELT